jgi:hypothetical protein
VSDAVRRSLDRYPFNSPWIRGLVRRHWLPVWFAANSIVALVYAARDTSLLYFDARLYLDATRTWLAGGDPWSVELAGNYFAAPPPSLLPLAPLAVLPPDLGVAILAALVIGGAVATVRLLHLPWWWILFPPLVQCMLSANVHGLLIPLILLRAGAIATLLKVYAGVTLLVLGRWQALLIAGVVIVLTVPLLPWGTYIADFAMITERLADQTKHHIPLPVLVAISPAVVFGLAVIGRAWSAWLAPLALWPSQQYYYGTLVMPVRSDVAAAIIALPVTGSGIIAVGVLAALEWRRGGRPRWPTTPGTREPLGPSVR